MKQLVAVFTIVSVSTFGSASAAGFAPWENAERAAGRSIPDVTQQDIEIRSFYRSNNNVQEDFKGEPQADVQIVPWYAADRV